MQQLSTSKHLSSSMMAGLIATGGLSDFILLASALGVVPAVNVPAIIAASVGSPDAPLLGWTVLILIGVVIYGAAMAALS